MLPTAHRCAWTRRRATELTHRDRTLHGAGVPVEVLATAAAALGGPWLSRPSPRGESECEIAVGGATGETHDECFFVLTPATQDLKRALLDAVLALHSSYLETDIDWTPVIDEILVGWTANRTIRLRASRASCTVTVRTYEAGAGVFARALATVLRIDASSGVARLRR